MCWGVRPACSSCSTRKEHASCEVGLYWSQSALYISQHVLCDEDGSNELRVLLVRMFADACKARTLAGNFNASLGLRQAHPLYMPKSESNLQCHISRESRGSKNLWVAGVQMEKPPFSALYNGATSTYLRQRGVLYSQLNRVHIIARHPNTRTKLSSILLLGFAVWRL
eukprot:1494006-Amphidinium_carterae.2